MKIEYKESWNKNFNNYSNVLIKDDLMDLTIEDLKRIKDEAQKYINRSKQKALNGLYVANQKEKNNYSLISIEKNPIDIKFKRRKLNDDNTTLTLIQANVSCSNPETLINILLDNKTSYNTLAIISRDIDNLKLLSILENKLNELLKQNIDDKNLKLLKLIIQNLKKENELLNSKINEIAKIFEEYYALNDINIIIARLLQITVFERNLYKEKEKQLINKRGK